MNPVTLPPSTCGARHPPTGPVCAVPPALTSHTPHFQDSGTKAPRSTCRPHIYGAALGIAGEVYGCPTAAGPGRAASATSRCRAGGVTPPRPDPTRPDPSRGSPDAAAGFAQGRRGHTVMPGGEHRALGTQLPPRDGRAPPRPRAVPAPADGGGSSAQSGVGPREPRSAAPAPPPASPHGGGRRSRPSATGRPAPGGGRCPAFPPHARLGPAPRRAAPLLTSLLASGSGGPQGVHMGAEPRQPSPLPAQARPRAAPRSREVSAGARCGCGR